MQPHFIDFTSESDTILRSRKNDVHSVRNNVTNSTNSFSRIIYTVSHPLAWCSDRGGLAEFFAAEELSFGHRGRYINYTIMQFSSVYINLVDSSECDIFPFHCTTARHIHAWAPAGMGKGPLAFIYAVFSKHVSFMSS